MTPTDPIPFTIGMVATISNALDALGKHAAAADLRQKAGLVPTKVDPGPRLVAGLESVLEHAKNGTLGTLQQSVVAKCGDGVVRLEREIDPAPARNLPEGVWVEKFDLGWYPCKDKDKHGSGTLDVFFKSNLSWSGKTYHKILMGDCGFPTESSALAAYWKWHDEKPGNQPAPSPAPHPAPYTEATRWKCACWKCKERQSNNFFKIESGNVLQSGALDGTWVRSSHWSVTGFLSAEQRGEVVRVGEAVPEAHEGGYRQGFAAGLAKAEATIASLQSQLAAGREAVRVVGKMQALSMSLLSDNYVQEVNKNINPIARAAIEAARKEHANDWITDARPDPRPYRRDGGD